VRLYLGVARNREDLDAGIALASRNWRVDRMSPVDRALIRLAYYEMRFRPEVPVKAVLNEAIELAKGYGDSDSRAFVNGVLDRLASGLEGRARAGQGPAAPRGAGAGSDMDAEAGVDAKGKAEAEADAEDEAEDEAEDDSGRPGPDAVAGEGPEGGTHVKAGEAPSQDGHGAPPVEGLPRRGRK
jgi:hypothetical protein